LYDLNVTCLGRSNTYEFKFNRKIIVLKLVKPKSSVRNNKERTVTKMNDKTPCHLVSRTYFSHESPIDGSTPRPKNSLGLLPLPHGIPSIATVEPSVPHLHKLHEHNIRQMTVSNCNY